MNDYIPTIETLWAMPRGKLAAIFKLVVGTPTRNVRISLTISFNRHR